MPCPHVGQAGCKAAAIREKSIVACTNDKATDAQGSGSVLATRNLHLLHVSLQQPAPAADLIEPRNDRVDVVEVKLLLYVRCICNSRPYSLQKRIYWILHILNLSMCCLLIFS